MPHNDQQAGACLALDVGGTNLKAAVYDDSGHSVLELRRPSPPDRLVERVLEVLQELAGSAQEAGYQVQAIGLVVPGVVDQAGGVVIEASNLNWRNLPLRSLVEERTGLPVAFGHDVRAGGLAEFRLGAAKGTSNALILPVGTGIAGAMICGGQLIEGSRVGEIGHLDVGTGIHCACGAVGCLETVASAGAIARRYSAATGRRVSGASEVTEALRGGDPAAQAVWDEAISALARALACYITLLAPELVVVGGGLARAGETLLAPLRQALEERLSFQHLPRVVHAALGDLAGCIGAGLLAADLISGTPTAAPATAGVRP